MLLLACDTSNATCSACLYQDGQVRSSSFLDMGRTHSQNFMPMLHQLMESSGFAYQDLDALACTVGPGSFTGIRIGVSSIKVMAMVLNKPAIPVSSLEALSYPFSDYRDTLIVPLLDARNRRVFSAAYYNGQQVISEDARNVDELIALCQEEIVRLSEEFDPTGSPSIRILLCGDGAQLYRDEAFFKDRQVLVNPLFSQNIQPAAVAQIAYNTFAQQTSAATEKAPLELFPPQNLMPSYRAKTQAERLFSAKGGDLS